MTDNDNDDDSGKKEEVKTTKSGQVVKPVIRGWVVDENLDEKLVTVGKGAMMMDGECKSKLLNSEVNHFEAMNELKTCAYDGC